MDAKEKLTERESPTEVDLALRAITRLFPSELAAALLPTHKIDAGAAWIETQLASRERRLDRLLAVSTEGTRRWLHVEWMLSYASDLPWRMFEYHSLAAMAARVDAEASRKAAGTPGDEITVPGLESTLVLLSGKEAPWPTVMEHRSSPIDAPFCGVKFRVEAVYQRTITELRAKGLLWLIFAPLAVDATPEALAAVVAEVHGSLDLRTFADYAAAMLVLAEADARRRGLRAPLAAFLPMEIIMQSEFLQEIREQGKKEGKKEGRAEGEARAILGVLKARGIAVPEDVRAQIAACTDLATLEDWLRRAVVLKTARAVVRPPKSSG